MKNKSALEYKTNGFYYGFAVDLTSITPIPELRISQAATKALVSWEADATYILESALNATGPWPEATNAVATTNSTRFISFNPTEQRRFFRLKKTLLVN